MHDGCGSMVMLNDFSYVGRLGNCWLLYNSCLVRYCLSIPLGMAFN